MSSYSNHYNEVFKSNMDRWNDSVREREEKEFIQREAVINRFPYLAKEDYDYANSWLSVFQNEYEKEEYYKKMNAKGLKEYIDIL